jgi:hypothetical protein
MKKTVQIVTIPLNKEGWSKGDIINDGKFTSIGIYSSEGFGNWQPQQLLVLSDDEIQINNYVYWDNRCLHVGGPTALSAYKGYASDAKKVIASYPQLEGTLPISKETVQAWIDAGTPGEGSVEMKHKCTGRNTIGTTPAGEPIKMNSFIETPKLDPQGNLLLEFGEKIELKEIGEKLKDRILFPDALEHAKDYLSKVVKPSIPTDEEIEEKGCSYYNGNDTSWLSDRERIATAYLHGYKQALKDLVISKPDEYA